MPLCALPLLAATPAGAGGTRLGATPDEQAPVTTTPVEPGLASARSALLAEPAEETITNVTVDTEAEYRAALASPPSSGIYEVTLSSDIVVDGGSDPTYSGAAELHLRGRGLDAAGTSRLLRVTSDVPVFIDLAWMRNGRGEDGGAIRTMGTQSLTEIHHTVFVGNQAQFDGGAIRANGRVRLVLTTFVDNLAGWSAFQGAGGAVYTSDDLTVHGGTFVDNRARPTSAQTLHVAGRFDVVLAVISGAPGNHCSSGSVLSFGYSFEAGTSCGFQDPPDQQGVGDLRLGPLRDNGTAVPATAGVPTVLPLAGSPVIDALTSGSQCGSPNEVDLRGVVRGFGAGCDSGATEGVYPPHAMKDVPSWVEAAVRWVTSPVNDPVLMSGYPGNTFRADLPISRGQVVRMAYRLAGAPDVTGLPAHGLTDVPAWIESAVRWAVANNIVSGYPDSTFRADLPISRGQVVRMVYRLAGAPDPAGLPAHGLSDVPAWIATAVRWAANPDNPLPLIAGYPDSTFRADLPITRGQVARMLWRLAITPEAWTDPALAPRTVPLQTDTYDPTGTVLNYQGGSPIDADGATYPGLQTYDSFATAVARVVETSPGLPGSLTQRRCVVLSGQTTPFSATHLDQLAAYVRSGGTIITVAEADSIAGGPQSQTQQNHLLTHLGTGITNVGGDHDPGFNSTPTVSNDPLVAGLGAVRYGRTGALTTTGNARFLYRGVSNQTILAVEDVGDGMVVAAADLNILSDRSDNGYGPFWNDELAARLCA